MKRCRRRPSSVECDGAEGQTAVKIAVAISYLPAISERNYDKRNININTCLPFLWRKELRAAGALMNGRCRGCSRRAAESLSFYASNARFLLNSESVQNAKTADVD